MRSRDVGALAHEIPYWGWMTDHTCLTLGGELVTVGVLAPVAVDGRAAGDLDAVSGRWQQMLSGLPDGMRLSWIIERRAVGFPDPPADLGDIAALAHRKRHAFLADRVQDVTVHVVWCFNPRLRQTVERRNGHGGWVRAYVEHWRQRRRTPHESVYLAADLDRAVKNHESLVAASIARVADATEMAARASDRGGGGAVPPRQRRGRGVGRRHADRCRGELAHGGRGPGGGTGTCCTSARRHSACGPASRPRRPSPRTRWRTCTAGYRPP